MIVFVLLLSVGKLTGNARRPDDDSLLFDVVPEEFGCPDINGSRIGHHLNEALLTPVYQVLGTGIAEASVAAPAAGPYQMECAVGSANDGRVAHHALMTDLRSQPDAVDLLPVPAVATVDKAQAFRGRLVEGC